MNSYVEPPRASTTPAGAALGAAIGEAVRTSADFNDCMKASGWVPVKDKPAQTAFIAPTPAASASVQIDPPAPPARCTQEQLETADLAKKQGYNYQLPCTP